MHAPPEIRPAGAADAATLAAFNVAMARETEHRALDPDRVAAGVRALLDDPAKGAYYVAVLDGAVVGQLLITHEWSDWRNGDFWWIQSVYVAPGFRSRGVFKALFAHVHALARSRPDVCGVRLYMERDNATARAVYERLGLTATPYQVFEIDFTADGR